MATELVQPQHRALSADYFRIRDYEYAQPLYDLAFLLEVEALMAGREAPKYRIFSLWKAAYRIDSYTSSIDKWLDGELSGHELDYVPSGRIRQYLEQIRSTGRLQEITKFDSNTSRHIFRLRAIRGIGAAGIARIVRENQHPSLDGSVLTTPDSKDAVSRNTLNSLPEESVNCWQAAHVIPPLLRFLREIELSSVVAPLSVIAKIRDGIQPVQSPFVVCMNLDSEAALNQVVNKALEAQPLFKRIKNANEECLLEHLQGWSFRLTSDPFLKTGHSVISLSQRLDPLTRRRSSLVKGDLHLHSTWSDGNSEIVQTAKALKKAGYEYFAITDHSRSCKLQGGLTPIDWVRQAISMQFQNFPCDILHGIEADILSDGRLDLPPGLLRGMDIVIGSVHSSWSSDINVNTLRIIRAIESGLVDILGHPTSSLIGKPGVPNYIRPSAAVDWLQVFKKCAQWRVALELNCFPSRLDLALPALKRAIQCGCWISLGSDAHARAHLQHLKFGEAMISGIPSDQMLNKLSFPEIKDWLRNAREHRKQQPVTNGELFVLERTADRKAIQIEARINTVSSLPDGGRVVGIDLTAGKGKPTGVALLEGFYVKTLSLVTDDELVNFVQEQNPKFVSIDSPLGLPGGQEEIVPSAGIVRIAERELASVGVPAYPALIDSMKELTLRGIRLKKRIEKLPQRPTVIESYPGAAQDILCISRKQEGLDLLRHGLRELGLTGSGLDTTSHDEMDAITSAIVGRYFEQGNYEPMGIPSEAQLIVPKTQPLTFEPIPVICLSGRTGSGKSVVARYLALFYGFSWVRTRELVRSLLIEDAKTSVNKRLFNRSIDVSNIKEEDLVEFGSIILNKYEQKPIREHLTKIISNTNQPVVIDSVRGSNDFDTTQISKRAICHWHVETNKAILQSRLSLRQQQTHRTMLNTHEIEKNDTELRNQADFVLQNNRSLEELRWLVDDTFFTSVTLQTSE